MIASDFFYDYIVSSLTLNFPVFSSAGVETNESQTYMLDVGGVSNPRFVRDMYVVKFYGLYNRSDYELGMEDLNTLKDNILGHPNITDTDGNDWCLFLLRQPPFFLSIDDIGRYVYTMEFEVTKDGATGVHRIPIN